MIIPSEPPRLKRAANIRRIYPRAQVKEWMDDIASHMTHASNMREAVSILIDLHASRGARFDDTELPLALIKLQMQMIAIVLNFVSGAHEEYSTNKNPGTLKALTEFTMGCARRCTEVFFQVKGAGKVDMIGRE